MSVWDDPEIRAGGEFVKFDKPGDKISGTITAIRTHRFDDGGVVPQILITTDDGDERTLTAGQVKLKNALAIERPEAGDHLYVEFEREERRTGGKTLKHFVVQVKRAGTASAAATPAPATTAAASSVTATPGDDGPPPGVDATVWAALPADKREQVRRLATAA